MYPAVEAVRERHPDDAEYLMVYVREAHPMDGWAMKSHSEQMVPGYGLGLCEPNIAASTIWFTSASKMARIGIANPAITTLEASPD